MWSSWPDSGPWSGGVAPLDDVQLDRDFQVVSSSTDHEDDAGDRGD